VPIVDEPGAVVAVPAVSAAAARPQVNASDSARGKARMAGFFM
jgi:hypothetical protein